MTEKRGKAWATWPSGLIRTARKAKPCEYANGPCGNRMIEVGELYFDPMESNPNCAGGLGGYRFCRDCVDFEPEMADD